jgi:hypothetical protein
MQRTTPSKTHRIEFDLLRRPELPKIGELEIRSDTELLENHQRYLLFSLPPQEMAELFAFL